MFGHRVLRMRFILFSIWAIVLLFPVVGSAKSSNWVTRDQVRVQLSSAVGSVGAEVETIEALLELDLAKDWHTYWKHPGEAGLAPRFDWSGSENVADVALGWPVPQRKKEQELFTVFSYAGKVNFPLNVVLKEPGEPALLDVKAQIMVCKDVCIPEKFTVSLAIPAGKGEASNQAKRIARAFATLPMREGTPAFDFKKPTVEGDLLYFQTNLTDWNSSYDIYAYTDDFPFTAKAEFLSELDADTHVSSTLFGYIQKPDHVENLAEALAGQTLHVLFLNGSEALEKEFQF